MERYRGKKALIVGLGRTGFSYVNFFTSIECFVRVTDIKPIFDLNKQVKRLKRVKPSPEMTFGEHKDDDFLEADVIVYSSKVSPELPQLELARKHGKEVYSEFEFAYRYCKKPIVAICGSFGRTSIVQMVGYSLRLDGKKVFVGGDSTFPFIEYHMMPDKDEVDFIVVEASSLQLQTTKNFHPRVLLYTGIGDEYPHERFRTVGEFIETMLSPIKNLTQDDYLIVNYDKLSTNSFFKNSSAQTYWYSRRSFATLGVMNEVEGTHFHGMRIHSNIHFHSEFIVKEMRIIGQNSRENLLAAITALKAVKASDKSIQLCIEKFPGIPNRLEFVVEKNGVKFYNDSKSEKMDETAMAVRSFKEPVILIAGGKEEEQDFEKYFEDVKNHVRVLVLVGEAKERMNRLIGHATQTYIVGSFEESILFAYQKSRTGDIILLSPGNPSTDVFRDYEERGNYYKKLIYQL